MQCIFYLQATKLKQIDRPFRWIITNHKNKSDVSLKDFYFGVGSRVFLINQMYEEYQIKAIYKISPYHSNFKMDHIAVWNNITRFTEYNELLAPKNRSNLEGLTLGLSYVASTNDTLLHLDDYR